MGLRLRRRELSEAVKRLARPGFALAAWVACLALASPASGAAAATPRPSLDVAVTREAHGDLLSVNARQTPLGDVLAEVARRAGFELSAVLPLAGRRVSVSFDALSLEHALRRLLAGESFALVYRSTPAGARLSRVLLLGPHDGPLGAPEPEGSASTLGRRLDEDVDEAPRFLPEDAQAFDPDGPLEVLLVLARHPDYRMRARALEALSARPDDPRAWQTLLERARDPEPRVRNVVVGLLGPHLRRWPGAEEVVWSALRDIIAPVRGTALLALWEAASPRAGDALRLALGDADLAVRALAEALSAAPSRAATASPGRPRARLEEATPCRPPEICP